MSAARTARRAAERAAAKLARKAETATQSTPAQIEANRENATHSTGPVTAEGKAAVSQNRRVHGLNYNAATFTVLPCEDQSEYDNLYAMLSMTHEPENFTEGLLVVSMAQHRWLVDRAARLQETCFDPETGQITDQKLFALYLRYQATNERAFHKCLNDLLNLRAQKQKQQIGFESQKRLDGQHKMKLDYHEVERNYIQTKTWREEADEERAKWLFERQKSGQQAA